MRLAIFAAGVVIADAIQPLETDMKMVVLVMALFALFALADSFEFAENNPE